MKGKNEYLLLFKILFNFGFLDFFFFMIIFFFFFKIQIQKKKKRDATNESNEGMLF